MNAVHFLHQWYGQIVLLPLVISWVIARLLKVLWVGETGPRVASASAGAAFIATYFVTVGLPAWPAAGSSHQILYLSLGGLLIGVVLDSEGAGDRLRSAAVLTLPLAAVAWLVSPILLEAKDYALAIPVTIAAIIVFTRLSRTTASVVTAPVELAIAAAGLAAISWYSGSYIQVQLGMSLAAAVTGFILSSWLLFRFLPGAGLLLGVGIPTVALAVQMALYGSASKIALAILPLVFFSNWIAGGIHLGHGKAAQAMRPLLTLVVGGLVVGAAALLAVLSSEPSFEP